MKSNLGSLLKKTRLEKDLTKEELAKRIGVNKVTISKWEKNISKPSFSNILLLTKELGVTFDELILGYSIDKTNKKKSEEEIKSLLMKNARYKSIFNVFTGIFVCLCLCFLEVILYRYNILPKDANYIFLLLLFIICFSAFTEGLEKANLFEERNKYREYGLLLILGYVFAISGFVISILI